MKREDFMMILFLGIVTVISIAGITLSQQIESSHKITNGLMSDINLTIEKGNKND